MSDTIVELRQLSEDEQKRAEAYYREKRQHDKASALSYARKEEREAIADRMRRNGFTEEQIKLVPGDFYE